MTVEEFQNKIKKEYFSDKYLNYLYAFSALGIGIFFIYKLLFTNWSEGLTIKLFLFTLLISFYLLYLGIIGFIRTPHLDQIEIISKNPNIELNKENIAKTAKKLNLKSLPSEQDCLMKFQTKNFFFEKRDLIVLVNDKGIYAHIQQRNWNGPTFMGYKGSIKILQKFKIEIKRLQLK